MTTLLAFHNDPKIKAKYLDRVQAHQAADELVQGVAWENGKGCAIGCTLENYSHTRYPIELGIPEELARLEDCIFEGLKNGAAQKWPGQFLLVIKSGADLSMVWPRFALWLLTEELAPYLTPTVKPAVVGVAELYRRWIDTGVKPAVPEWWSAARSAARSAAESAAWSAESAAWSAESAAWSARSAAWSAARSAAWSAWSAESAARSAAKTNAWQRQASKLLELLAAAPIGGK